MIVTLDKGPVQSLLLDEPLDLPAVTADKVLAPVGTQESDQLVQRLDGEVTLAQVQHKVPVPVGDFAQEMLHAGQHHLQEGGTAPDCGPPDAGQTDV